MSGRRRAGRSPAERGEFEERKLDSFTVKTTEFVSIFGAIYAQQEPESLHKKCGTKPCTFRAGNQLISQSKNSSDWRYS